MTKKNSKKEKSKSSEEKDNVNMESSENNKDDKIKKESKKEEKTEDTVNEVKQLKEQIEEQKDKYHRLLAEFDNFKRRTSREYDRMVESANERLMMDIIDTRESFERAISMADDNSDPKKFFEGVKLIYNKFNGVLEKNGLSTFGKVGDEFDAELHDAMIKVPHESIPEDHITEIYENGYKLKERVIKHAKVVVSSGAPTEDDNEEK